MGWLTNLLKKKSKQGEMPNVHWLKLDISGWKESESSDKRVVWFDKDGDVLSVDYIENSPDLGLLSDIESVRDHCRRTSNRYGHGIVSVDVINLSGVPAIKVIDKREVKPTYAYDGMLIIPFKNFSYYVVIASRERGTTGLRDAVVSAQLMNEGKLEIDWYETPDSSGRRRLKGWFRDPYDPGYKGIVLNSVADDEKYDSLFPNHPLSKVRWTLRQIQDSIKFEEKLQKEFR